MTKILKKSNSFNLFKKNYQKNKMRQFLNRTKSLLIMYFGVYLICIFFWFFGSQLFNYFGNSL